MFAIFTAITQHDFPCMFDDDNFFLYIFLKKHLSYAYLLLAFGLGFTWAAFYSHTLLSRSFPSSLEGKVISVTGTIASLPIIDKQQAYFEFYSSQYHLIRLSWRECPYPLKAGDTWQLNLRLKRIHGVQNPGGFDFEAWALQKGLSATGYVVSGELVFHGPYHYVINQFRQTFLQKIQSQLPATPTAPWLIALILGERSQMPQTEWEVLRKTGTNHLMAIAGLHIGLLAFYMHKLFAGLWRFYPPLVLRLPAQYAGAIAGLTAALFYSALAGFSLPTQRACIMLVVFTAAFLFKRKINSWQAGALALFIVLVLNPASILTESFCLSFFTIFLIIYGMEGRLMPQGLWWKWGRVQWVIGLGLLPLSLALFQELSFISFFANCIAIPWMGFFILPFCFLSSVFIFIFPGISGWLLYFGDKSLGLLWLFLSSLAGLHFSFWEQAMPNNGVLLASITGILLLLLPRGMPGRALGIIYILPLLFYKPVRPLSGEVWLTVLDVGQGLSTVIQTHRHTLLYDTGPKYNAQFDMGERVVLPYLFSAGIKEIDTLVISHGDLDHIGGAQAILNRLPVKSIFTSVPEALALFSPQYCLAGYSWQWDEVKFTFLYPTQENLHLKNDSSCVLKIDNGKQSLLLTGDIEKHAESDLINRIPQALATRILIAPHHGSKTSGLATFISAAHPQFVIYATGYRNRYHFPHPSIVEAYREIEAQQLNTVDTGAIQFKLERDVKKLHPIVYRVVNKHYWFN